jgi:hypothetical protein
MSNLINSDKFPRKRRKSDNGLTRFIRLFCSLFFAAAFSIVSFAQSAKTPEQMISEISDFWIGRFDNHLQVANNIDLGEPTMPELTREKREIKVERLNAPQLGKVVLFLEEYRETSPKSAHRQRVMTLTWDTNSQKVRVNQFFFKKGPAYDRKPLEAKFVAGMPISDFEHIVRCDLFLAWDAKLSRYNGGMIPKACTYQHPVDGEVYAEFDMLLWKNGLWYRDRSLRVSNGTVRGEIDGFSWLRFKKKTPLPREEFANIFPAISRQEGVWIGRFRRYDAEGNLMADLSSEITVKLDFSNEKTPFHQTNKYTFADGKTQIIESEGRIEGNKLFFSNAQIEGWATDLISDDNKRTSIFFFKYKDGSNIYVYEIVTLSDDGKIRSRATQYLKNGKIIRRTLIDEVKR